MSIAPTTLRPKLRSEESKRGCRSLTRSIPNSRIAVGLFAIHFALLFLPPIPPFYKGSLWSFLLAYGSLVLLLCHRKIWVPRLADWWVSIESRARALRVLVILGAIGGLGAALRATAPEVFARFSREEGIWEPITLLAFLASALVLGLHATRASDGGVRRHLRLLAAGFALLALEEVDYFGIFGGMIGRIEGTYAGALHDVIRLWTKGLLAPVSIAVGASALVILAGALYRTGYLQPRALVAMIVSRQGIWLAADFALLTASTIQETAQIRPFASPSPEELLELLGSICLAAFALEAGDASRAGPPAAPATRAGVEN